MAAHHPSTEDAGNVWTSYRTRDRILLAVGAIASYWIFSALGALFSVPRFVDYQASLLGEPNPILAMLMVAVALLACAVLTSLFAGVVEREAGLFCAAIGLLALSTRGGPIRYVMMYSGSGVFLRLIVELVLLFAFIAVAWLGLRFLADGGLLPGHHRHDDDNAAADAPADAIPGQGWMALATTAVVMIVLMLIFARTDKKAQVVWAVGISSCVGAMCGHGLFPARSSQWFWPAPLLVGIIGYALALPDGTQLPGGAVGGYAAALGRALPLDYASVGVAAALLGYWTSRRWEHERLHDPQAPDEVEAGAPRTRGG